jgi:hypothetical protein
MKGGNRGAGAASAFGAIAVAALMMLAAHAGAATVGVSTSQIDNRNFGRSCGQNCTYVNARLSAGKTRAPVTGTITRWRANVGQVGVGTGPVPVKLQVLKRTADPPGVVADEYRAVRETPEVMTSVEGLNKFNASLKIRKGHFIGLAGLADDVEVYGLDGLQGNRALIFVPPFAPGDPAITPGTVLDGERILFNATIRK